MQWLLMGLMNRQVALAAGSQLEAVFPGTPYLPHPLLSATI